MQCILIEICSRAHAKGKKDRNDFQFGTFVGRFPSESAASMAVKGLKERNCDAVRSQFGGPWALSPVHHMEGRRLFHCRIQTVKSDNKSMRMQDTVSTARSTPKGLVETYTFVYVHLRSTCWWIGPNGPNATVLQYSSFRVRVLY